MDGLLRHETTGVDVKSGSQRNQAREAGQVTGHILRAGQSFGT